MNIRAMAWDFRSAEHIARHGVLQQEVEELIEGLYLTRRTRSKCSMVYGRTYAGRYLVVVIAPRSEGYAYVVTARDMTWTEKRWFRRRL